MRVHMDISKINKPLHIRCPRCKAELEYNPRKVRERLEMLKSQYASLGRKISQAKSRNEREMILKERDTLNFRMKLLKEDNNMINALLEEETMRIMKCKIRDEIGDKEYMRMLHEAEKEAVENNVFNTYEMAIQDYSNIISAAGEAYSGSRKSERV